MFFFTSALPALFPQLWWWFINLFLGVIWIFSSFLLLFYLLFAINLCKCESPSGTMKLSLLSTLLTVDSVLTSSQDMFGIFLPLCLARWHAVTELSLWGLLNRACWPRTWCCLKTECIPYIRWLVTWESFPTVLFYAHRECDFQEEPYPNGQALLIRLWWQCH